MSEKNFYSSLAGGETYLKEVRRFVPEYDRMSQYIIDEAKQTQPTEVLDVGCGVGNIDEELLQSVPTIQRLVGIDIDEAMISNSQGRLKDDGRVTLIKKDILDYETDRLYDFIFSNLVLHNIPHEKKIAALKKIHSLLRAGKPFLWNDLVRLYGKDLHEQALQERKQHALMQGANPDFAEQNYKKEAFIDSPVLIYDAKQYLYDAGFAEVSLVSLKDNSAIIKAIK